MRHTLSSRFQGGFLGAAIGEILAARLAAHPSEARAWAEIGFGGSLGAPEPLASEPLASHWGKWTIDQMCRLTRSPSAFSEPPTKPPMSLAGLAIALLPLAFFYHEDSHLLNRQVQRRLDQWQMPREAGMGAIAIGYAISLILREQVQPLDLIPQILAEMPDSAALTDTLTQVQSWLVEASIASQFSAHRLFGVNSLPVSISVSPTLVSLETIPIALALYAFLSTPEDFRLSLLRVAQFPSQNACVHRLTCSLTAALSGAHNGRGGLPQDWRRLLRDDLSRDNLARDNLARDNLVRDNLERRSPLSLSWDVRSESELLECVNRFVSAWSGMHNPVRHNLYSNPPVAVSIPRIIRPI
ncbi:MAG: ADP-ribosylglycohydrolase family protein [Drouetiella hepatica Uher 2000/2452]|jgi:hypothetical protein|uniref:ADP-ribosylglycohydrolase family protein n=1 Tax=Drouetiella hepatica Uher 2000/2452 TaxID=904376 RepID=A0A951QHE4_9CYAN|nr:ADP-ribosylglycohydrolase family protein [Drouetiella hepatica Uher 2000/2452]